MRDTSYYARIACAIVWSERRAGETYYDAAERAVEHMVNNGAKGITPEQALEFACQERADRLLRADASRRHREHGAPLDRQVDGLLSEHRAILEKLRVEVGLKEIAE